jgi:hypothetical protein
MGRNKPKKRRRCLAWYAFTILFLPILYPLRTKQRRALREKLKRYEGGMLTLTPRRLCTSDPPASLPPCTTDM